VSNCILARKTLVGQTKNLVEHLSRRLYQVEDRTPGLKDKVDELRQTHNNKEERTQKRI
jgi:hypothetical protein